MAIEDRYNWQQFDLQYLQQKKHPITHAAYYIAYNCRLPSRPLYHVRIGLDCDGCPVPKTVSKMSSTGFAQNCPGAEWANPHWSCAYDWGWHKTPGTIIDIRSWFDIILGCCPPWGDEY